MLLGLHSVTSYMILSVCAGSSSLSATLDRDKIPPTLATKTTTDAVWRRPECSNCPTTVLPPLEDPVQGTTDDASISKLYDVFYSLLL